MKQEKLVVFESKFIRRILYNDEWYFSGAEGGRSLLGRGGTFLTTLLAQKNQTRQSVMAQERKKQLYEQKG